MAKTKQDLYNDIDSRIPNVAIGDSKITPLDIRSVLKGIVD